LNKCKYHKENIEDIFLSSSDYIDIINKHSNFGLFKVTKEL